MALFNFTHVDMYWLTLRFSILAFFLSCAAVATSQTLFVLEDELYAIVQLKDGKSVQVCRTIKTADSLEIGQVQSTIYQLNNGSYTCTSCSQTDFDGPIRSIVNCEALNDLLRPTVFGTPAVTRDSNGRVLTISGTQEKQPFTQQHMFWQRYQYDNDTTTTVISWSAPGLSAWVTIARSDKRGRILSLKTGLTKDTFNLATPDWDYEDSFFYHKSTDLLLRVERQKYSSRTTKELTLIQSFNYKNGRPISSEIFDVRSQSVITRHTYSYK